MKERRYINENVGYEAKKFLASNVREHPIDRYPRASSINHYLNV